MHDPVLYKIIKITLFMHPYTFLIAFDFSKYWKHKIKHNFKAQLKNDLFWHITDRQGNNLAQQNCSSFRIISHFSIINLCKS